jgi:hypothetical protein
MAISKGDSCSEKLTFAMRENLPGIEYLPGLNFHLMTHPQE